MFYVVDAAIVNPLEDRLLLRALQMDDDDDEVVIMAECSSSLDGQEYSAISSSEEEEEGEVVEDTFEKTPHIYWIKESKNTLLPKRITNEVNSKPAFGIVAQNKIEITSGERCVVNLQFKLIVPPLLTVQFYPNENLGETQDVKKLIPFSVMLENDRTQLCRIERGETIGHMRFVYVVNPDDLVLS